MLRHSCLRVVAVLSSTPPFLTSYARIVWVIWWALCNAILSITVHLFPHSELAYFIAFSIFVRCLRQTHFSFENTHKISSGAFEVWRWLTFCLRKVIDQANASALLRCQKTKWRELSWTIGILRWYCADGLGNPGKVHSTTLLEKSPTAGVDEFLRYVVQCLEIVCFFA